MLDVSLKSNLKVDEREFFESRSVMDGHDRDN